MGRAPGRAPPTPPRPPRPVASLSLVLPAHDEAENLEKAVAAAREAGRVLGLPYEVIVVDDGSTDDTAAIADRLAAAHPEVRVVRHARNEGYGAALTSGFRAARMGHVFFTDADLQFDLADLASLIPLAGEAEIVAGRRAPRADPWHRRLYGYGWSRLVGALLDLPVTDVNCAFKLIDRHLVETMRIDARGAFVNAEILARAAAAGARVVEVPVRHRPRRAGRSTGADPRVILRAFGELARLAGTLRRARRAPDQGESA